MIKASSNMVSYSSSTPTAQRSYPAAMHRSRKPCTLLNVSNNPTPSIKSTNSIAKLLSSLPPNSAHTINHHRIRMPPKARQHPPTPPIRRLLLHNLQPSRRRHLRLPILLPARELLPVRIEHTQSC